MRASRINQNRSDPILLRNPDAGVLPEFPEGPCPEENFCLSYSKVVLAERIAKTAQRKLQIATDFNNNSCRLQEYFRLRQKAVLCQ